MAVLITRHDPRSGDTVYRLTNILRTEPSSDLFTVPSEYQVQDMKNMIQSFTIEGRPQKQK